jgi:hypothetical protein
MLFNQDLNNNIISIYLYISIYIHIYLYIYILYTNQMLKGNEFIRLNLWFGIPPFGIGQYNFHYTHYEKTRREL